MNNCIIFSVCQHKDSQQDDKACITTKRQLDWLGVPWYTVLGCYGGTKETSFVVANKYRRHAIGLCALYSQECWLAVDSAGAAALHYPDGRIEQLGELHVDATAVDNYTLDLATGLKWGTTK